MIRSSLMTAATLVAMEAAASDAAAGGQGQAGLAAGAGNQGGKPRAESEKVTMEDGRTVEFAGKRKLLKEVVIAEGSLPAVRFDFRNGKSRLFTVPEALYSQFAAHGASQKIGDETAGEDDVDDMVLAVDDLIDRLSGDPQSDPPRAPEWSAKREGGGFGGVSVLLRALMWHSGKDQATVQSFLKPKSHAEKMALRTHGPIKVIIERLEAEKAAKAAGANKVNAGELLATL